MTEQELLKIHQRRVARIAVSASAARNQGDSGVVEAAREFLSALDCRRFSEASGDGFSAALDQATEEFCQALPGKARTWGLSRKLLNIFLRDVLYHSLLAEPSGLGSVVDQMEVPLDSITAERIKKNLPPRTLPAWPGVKNLTPHLSERFQLASSEIARDRGVDRVHLDAIWWGAREL